MYILNVIWRCSIKQLDGAEISVKIEIENTFQSQFETELKFPSENNAIVNRSMLETNITT